MIKRLAGVAICYLGMSAFLALLALALFYPHHPVTFVGGIFWFFAALPIWMIGEGIGLVLMNEKISRFINRDTSTTSIGRIGYGLIVALVLCTIYGLFIYLLGEGLGPFFEKNFSNEW